MIMPDFDKMIERSRAFMPNLERGEFRILYVTSALSHLTGILESDVLHCLDAFTGFSKDKIYSSAVELLDNASQHGCAEIKFARFGVGIDDKGVFVECSSEVDAASYEFVEQHVGRLRCLTSDQIDIEEVSISLRHIGTNKSGLGLLQVLRYSAVGGEGREIAVVSEDFSKLGCLTLRSYIELLKVSEVA